MPEDGTAAIVGGIAAGGQAPERPQGSSGSSALAGLASGGAGAGEHHEREAGEQQGAADGLGAERAERDAGDGGGGGRAVSCGPPVDVESGLLPGVHAAADVAGVKTGAARDGGGDGGAPAALADEAQRAVLGQLVEVVLELAERDVPRAADASSGAFVAFADVYEDQAASAMLGGGLGDVEGAATEKT